jgi:hypothetical protein
MTSLAFDFLGVGMGPSEREIRPLVIERLVGNRSDVLRSSLVFRVALLTVPLFFEPSVGTLLLLDILANVFVTILAELVLRRFVESLMALGAVVLPLRMTFDHLARHQGRFDIVGPGVSGNKHQQTQGYGGDIAA